MRTMQSKDGTKLQVKEHIILKNFWEYYVIDDEQNTDDVVLCYVMGFENELGDVSLSEIKPYIITRTKDLREVMPPSNFTWLN